jgi:hypothetical protein
MPGSNRLLANHIALVTRFQSNGVNVTYNCFFKTMLWILEQNGRILEQMFQARTVIYGEDVWWCED